jgi:hypothetical protein
MHRDRSAFAHPTTTLRVTADAEQEFGTMLVAIFLLCLAAFIAVLYAIQWLLNFLAGMTMAGSVGFFIALGAMGAIAILARRNQAGIVLTVAIAVFWSLLLFGTDSATLMPTLTLAAAVLYAAAAVTVMAGFLRRAS